jgi:hypothetical protein
MEARQVTDRALRYGSRRNVEAGHLDGFEARVARGAAPADSVPGADSVLEGHGLPAARPSADSVPGGRGARGAAIGL